MPAGANEVATVDTVVLDLDGTLVDSVYEHVRAWKVAFQRVGLEVPGSRIHRFIGMGGDQLVAAVTNDGVERGVGNELRALHDEVFGRLVADVRPLPGAEELIRRIVGSGRKAVLATSSPPDQTDRMLGLVLGSAKLDAVVTGEDADDSKPEPDVVGVALRRVGAVHGLLVGDAVWDVESAARAGIGCIAVRSGGISGAELTAAGAIAVYDGPHDLAEALPGLLG